MDRLSDECDISRIDDYTLSPEEIEKILQEHNDDSLSIEERDRIIQEYNAECSAVEEKKSNKRITCPISEVEYDVLLGRHQQICGYSAFDKDDHHARSYFKMKDILDGGEISHLSARAQCRHLAKQFSVKFGTVKAWFMQNKIPRFVELLGRLERRRLGLQPVTVQERRQYFPR
ncbi:MAG: hypothetical protein RTU92_11435, partial [Candidatus Thorarchaeota archaeon]